jgi:transcriptional regulator with XRE-family HTH domain
MRRKGLRVRKTIQERREERGESRDNLAAAVGVTLSELTEWKLGRAQPGVARMRLVSEYVGVRDDPITLDPHRDPSLDEHRQDALLP